MKDKLSKIINKKIFIIILIIILISTTLLIGTNAWFTWSSTDNTSLTLTIGKIADVVFTNGNQIDGKLNPVYNYTDGLSTSFSIYNKVTDGSKISYNVYLNITTIAPELKNNNVKFVLTKNGEVVKEGNMSTASNGDTITLESGTLATGNTSYMFYLYIDGNVENDDAMMNKSIVGTITVDAFENNNPLLINHIKNLYTSGTPTLITQETSGDSYYYSYQDTGSTWGLMNDGFTIDTTQDEETTGLAKVVTDATKLTSGSEGNIRYFGPSGSVNNYIYFNCDNYSNQSSSTCELWRIIGIVDGKVKIIKKDSIGNLAWDLDKNQDSSLTTYSNNWATSSLQLFLNGLYYNRGTTESHTYYSGSDGSTETTLDLTDIGITEATRNNNLISESTWYLGGRSTTSIYPNDIYNYERQNIVGTTISGTNPFTIDTNIGLMYASDYGYGTDLTKCSDNIYKYNSSTNSYACRANNWLFNSANQWFITPDSSYLSYAWSVKSSGYVDYDFSGVYYAYSGVRPVLYLNSELSIESEGEGTDTNPYRISLS